MAELKQTKQVIVVITGLNMRKGKIAAQVAHASLGVILAAMNKQDSSCVLPLKEGTALTTWINNSFTKICVGVDTEQELLKLIETAKSTNIPHCLITDSGKTEFNGVPTITCAAFGPHWSEELDKLTGHLKLL